ncbi:PLC-like phosphodiesterase [Lenzites betulinus]|nr:PLC-like phosphodiesterase [Lenzites betulinus]
MASFLSDMPDSLPLSALVLPGTHDTMAFYGWPVSQCQSLNTPLNVQLRSGIRVLDVRLAVVDGRLIAYHGIFPQRTPFQDILVTIYTFFTAPATCREALVMSIKQEDFARTPLPLFSQLVHDEIADGPGGFGMWFLQNRIPTLGEVRGRVVLFSRFGGDGSGWEGGLEGLGIHPTAWPDSEKDGFTWTLKGTLVRTHDWYNIPSFLSIPEKTELATQILVMPPQSPPYPVLNITFLSAASFPLAFPPTIAKGFGWPKWGFGIEGVNGRVGQWLLDQLSDSGMVRKGETATTESQGEDVRIRGWVFVDYYAEPEDGALVPLLVECNYRGRRKGEEGWEY